VDLRAEKMPILAQKSALLRQVDRDFRIGVQQIALVLSCGGSAAEGIEFVKAIPVHAATRFVFEKNWGFSIVEGRRLILCRLREKKN